MRNEEQRPRNVHPIDLQAQALYDRVQKQIAYIRERFDIPVPVGQPKISAGERARAMMGMRPELIAQLIAQRPLSEPIFSTALDKLGAHSLALLPYLTGGMPEAPPPYDQGGVF